MARFEREANVLASLNHPHIAQIYGIEEHALVMELVEGETLMEKYENTDPFKFIIYSSRIGEQVPPMASSK